MAEVYNNKEIEEISEKKRRDFETRQNLAGFFGLLLKIDKRNNPEKYKKNRLNETNNQNQQ